MRLWLAAASCALLPALASTQPAVRPPTDLDRLMEEVVQRRDDNWQKLQQYILSERQRVTVTGPEGLRLYGFDREYQWFVKDGFFVRSPLSANGVSISESERRAYEARYLRRQQRRDERRATRAAERGEPAPAPPPEAVGDLLRQQSEPNFISAAYFLRFKFDPGRYALAGRETMDGREVLRVEYYPTRLFDDDKDDKTRAERRAEQARRRDRREDDEDERIEQQMNKASLVTLWVLRDQKQIVRYVFDNVDLGFLPGRSVLRIDELTASMRMREAFPDIWLPEAIGARMSVATALGSVGAVYDIRYSDYRQAGVTVRVK
ncbi:MAG: hypothetical protein AB7O28_05435 [Vicinamibacterales bacterium]